MTKAPATPIAPVAIGAANNSTGVDHTKHGNTNNNPKHQQNNTTPTNNNNTSTCGMKLSANPPSGTVFSKFLPFNFAFPMFMAFLVHYGTNIIHNSLPSIPFLFPAAIFLTPMCITLPFLIRGALKTLVAFFFLFAAVQNIFYYQLHTTFFDVNPHYHINAATAAPQLSKPLNAIHFPHFLVLTNPNSLCTRRSEDVAQQYAEVIAKAQTMDELSYHFATSTLVLENIKNITTGAVTDKEIVMEHINEIDCVDIDVVFTLSNVLSVGFTKKEYVFQKTTTIPTEPVDLLRMAWLTTHRSIIPTPAPLLYVLKRVAKEYLQLDLLLHTTIPTALPQTIDEALDNSPIFNLYKTMTTTQKWLVLGFFFSFAGDVLLIFGYLDIFFLFGLVAFLFGHIGFLGSYCDSLFNLHQHHLPTFPIQAVCSGAVLLACIVLFQFWVKSTGKVNPPMNHAILLYSAIIASMVCSAWLLAFATPPTQVIGNSNFLPTTTPIFKSFKDGIAVVNTSQTRAADVMLYKPIIADSLLHFVNIALRVPMYIAADITANIHFFMDKYFGTPLLTNPLVPQEIAKLHLFSHQIVSNESWGYFFAAIGATLFAASDVFVAREKFVVSSPFNSYIGLPLYFVAQLLIANVLKYK